MGTATDLKWRDKFCPYCGKERMPLTQSRAIAEKFGVTYAVCKCEEAQAELKRSRAISDALQDIAEKIEFHETMIDNEKRKAEKLVKESLGRRFSNITFETFKVNADNKNAYKKCFEYVTEFPENKDGIGLIISGPVGTGKTHLAAAITHKIISDYGIPVQFKTAIEIHGELNEFEKATYDKYKKCDLLVIDDLGKEKSTDWRKEKIFEIINARYEDYLPTIITTNLTGKQLDDTFGAATFSRLCESCRYLELSGRDWRTR